MTKRSGEPQHGATEGMGTSQSLIKSMRDGLTENKNVITLTYPLELPVSHLAQHYLLNSLCFPQ